MSGFKMRSGNKPGFKNMGSSPAKATNPVEGEKKKPDFQKYDETNPDQREKSGSIEIDGKTKNYTLVPEKAEGGHLQYKVNWEKDEPVDTKTEENTDKKKKKRKKDTIFRDTNRDGTVVSRAAKKIFTKRKKGRRIKTKNLVSGGVNITNPWTGRTN